VCAGDDGIAMHGEYYAVASSNPSKHTVVVASNAGFPFDKGDGITFYSPDMEEWGTGIIQDSYSVSQPAESDGKKNTALPNFNYDDVDFMEVSMILDRKING